MPGNQNVRVGDVTIPAQPITALGARLREMQREIFVVHLAPLRGRTRGTRGSNMPSFMPMIHASESTLSDNEDVGNTNSSMEEDDNDSNDNITLAKTNRRTRSTASNKETNSTSMTRKRRNGKGVYNSETDDTDAEAVRTQMATNASDALEDERITCDFFDTRQGFLRMCQGNNYQFDTLRRAKHSSMMVLWHLHNPSIPAYAHACNVCETDIGCGTRWHCEACYDYDICDNCHSNPALNHPHPLVEKHDNNIVVQVANGYVAAGGNLYQASPPRGILNQALLLQNAAIINTPNHPIANTGSKNTGSSALNQALLHAASSSTTSTRRNPR